MLYFKHPERGDVFAFETLEHRHTFGSPELVPLTEEEVEKIINPPTDPEVLANFLRKKRDECLLETDWVVYRSFETGEPIPENYQNYRQALRDLTEQEGFPLDVVFPTLEDYTK